MTPRGRRHRALFRLPWRTATQIGADVDAEFRFHLDMRIDELVALGLAPDAAAERALREFGDLDDARRYVRAVDHDIEAARRRSDLMSDLKQDVVYAIRKLRAAPLFALTVIAILALGIGANTAIFSVVNGVLLRALPFPQPERLMRVQFFMDGNPDAGSPAEFKDYPAQSRAFQGFAMYDAAVANLVRSDGEAERLNGVEVSPNWFDLVGITPLLGRGFRAGEDAAGAPPVVVLSEGVWRRDFAGDSAIIGRGVRLNGEVRTVVGVMPAGRSYPLTAELWMPLVLNSSQLSDSNRGARYVAMLGRLRDGVTDDAARIDLHAIAKSAEQRFPDVYRRYDVRPMPLQAFVTGDLRQPLLVIMGAVALVLLIACANVANLMLVRAASRGSEMAIRTALGAGRGRLVRQLVTESLLLTTLGALAGVGLARVGMSFLLRLAPTSLPQLQAAHVDLATLLLTAAVAAVTGVLFGVLPALQGPRAALADALRAGARGARGLPSANRAKRVIVVAEVALAVMLLAGAGLLLRSFQHLMAVDPGFRTGGALTFRVSLPDKAYGDDAKVRQFVAALDAKLRALPGVREVGFANALPLDGSDFTISFTIHGHAPIPKNDEPAAQIVTSTPEFLSSLGIPLLRGRNFTAGDRDGAAQVALVSRSFATKYFRNEDPIGKYVELGWSQNGNRRGGTVVGVVGDVKQVALDRESPPTLYLPFDQAPMQSLRIALHTALPPASIAAAARAAVRSVDAELPVFSVRTLDDQIAVSIAPQRFYTTLVSLFAAVALALAAVGLYGVIAYTVSQRTHELGVRVALGATGDRIARMVIGEGLALTAAGGAIGIAASLAAGRVLAALLFGVDSRDPLTLISVAALLVLVAGVASWLPARRAARVDPLIAMRGD